MSELVSRGKFHTALCKTLAQFKEVETLSSAVSVEEKEEYEDSKDDTMNAMTPSPEELK